MNTGVIISLIIMGGVVWGEVLSCDSCGRECAAACGTRQFRSCCFNYLRKRTPPLEPLSLDPSLRLELWLARNTQMEIENGENFFISPVRNNRKNVDDYNLQPTN